MRAYALERLADSNERTVTARRHLAHFRRMAEQADESFGTLPIRVWLAPLGQDFDNMRAALRWAFDDGHSPADGVALVAALGWTFGRLAFYVEGRRWCERALALLSSNPDPRLEAHLQTALMIYYYFARDADNTLLEQGVGAGDRATALYRTFDDRKRLAFVLPWLGFMYALRGKREEGDKLASEGVAFARTLGERFRLSLGLCWKSFTLERGDIGARRVVLNEALIIAQELGDDVAIGLASYTLGVVALELGEAKRGREYFLESIARYELVGYRGPIVGVLGLLAWCALGEGDMPAARAAAHEAIVLRQQLHGGETAFAALFALCRLAVHEGRPGDGARLFGAAQKIHQPEQSWETLFDGKAMCDLAFEHLRSAFPEDELQSLIHEGALWSTERTFAEALGV